MSDVAACGVKNLAALKDYYRGHPIVIYAGAGVSIPDCERRKSRKRRLPEYGLPGWPGLLKRIFRERTEGRAGSFQAQPGWPDDLWATTDWVVEKCGGPDNFQEALVRVVQARQNYTHAYRQLNGTFLSLATTLAALVAFCARLLEQKESGDGDAYVYHTVVPNPRVRAILTSNYDAFLESASSTMFRDPILKPVAAHGSLAGDLRQTPVFHVHGYVPHPWQKKRLQERKPLRKELVLTEENYREAWDWTDVFGPTMSPQIHYLRHYVTLFIGFSFDDARICQLLRDLKEAERSCRHYALMKESDIVRRGSDFFKGIGVNPIGYRDHPDIPDKLREIYESGLAQDYPRGRIRLPLVAKRTRAPKKKTVPLGMHAYWPALLKSRNERVLRKHLSEVKRRGGNRADRKAGRFPPT